MFRTDGNSGLCVNQKSTQAWHKTWLAYSVMQRSLQQFCSLEGSGARPDAVLSVPVTPLLQRMRVPVVSASQRTDMALSELNCFGNPSSYILKMSVVGCFIKCIEAVVYAKNLILGLGICSLNCSVPGRQRKGPAQWEDGLMRTPCCLLRSVRQRIFRAATGSLGAWQLAIKMTCSRFGPSTWQTASHTGRSFTVTGSNSVCFEFTSRLGT